MSKIGKKPIKISEGVEVKIADGFLEFKGKEGILKLKILEYTSAEIKDGQLIFSVGENKFKQARANWGTMAALARNCALGVSQGFSKSLEIEGIGFRANMEGNTLVLNVGLTHLVKFPAPESIKISVEKSIIKISGPDKHLVGEVAAQIRKIKKPEPYKGTGIRYMGEIIRRKAGKKAITAAQ
ncbi:MAG: 50S ribosomal protein L6 [Candidatus Harrisonbacteria bacterium RIFCSPHIGHO2_01_FULL_44_13]|uniref:50S ribosomal protein L6 n=1 Tax=Candidatus Harrisonbacteria bacterium RIFCSPLOWO2_01_FULL_44_18 TaxID=1798407 RepID=A0A1G1ZNG5_9BACT|nr:MAG: 50S ribosomal protein L6 [Candidatus Harrisonbacteria bacterium RIFCSPHIGHO2_01_FULL_44_13]OGY65959.1 MAG: 50S ribosomal protein L6 [Candidatus Harrisonbacteria bacterium RIFCSPLOWO2_01_FULL_44_18]